MKRRRIKIIERRLNRSYKPNIRKVYGYAYKFQDLIEIEPRQKPRCFLNTLIHELLHVQIPELSESRVNQAAGKMTEAIWRMKFRRVAM